jgi:hypothetical protein
MVIEALAAAPDEARRGTGAAAGAAAEGPDASEPGGADACHCADAGGTSLFHEFSPFAHYRGDRAHA